MLTGWGRTAATGATLEHPDSTPELLEQLAGPAARCRGAVARGLGRSYGDPAQNAGGLVLDMTRMDRIGPVDEQAGTVRVEAGASIDQLIRELLPRGWFVPVTPGTRFVTVGGAIAADVHGKNHHRDGSFGRHVVSMSLALADGSIHEVSPEQDPELHWATIGGMGLTGVITEATVRLLPVTSSWMSVDTERARDLDALLGLLAAADRRRYSVAWIDLLASGSRAGRGVVTSAEHAPIETLDGRAGRRPEQLPPPARVSAPGWSPPGLLNRQTVAAFNQAWYLRAPAKRVDELQPLAAYFHPLDGIGGWNRLYGRRGLVQYQCVLPDEASLRSVFRQVRAARVPSFLAVLKRFGAGNPGPLSFPRPGWTLAFDVATATPGLTDLLDALDELVASVGGSIYLAKDSRTRPELIPAFYPRLAEWHRVRDRVDPNRRFVSDLSRRLSL